MPDDALFLWKDRFGALDPTRPVEPDPDDPARDDLLAIREALNVLGEARRGRDRRPIARTIGQLLAATRAHAGFAASRTGDQVLANVLRVGQLARRFEATGSSSFRAFVEALENAAERGESPDAPVVEEGTDGVRLMTVHKSKGLEFPVVILADASTAHTQQRPSRYIDASRRLWALPLAGCTPADLRDHADEVLEDDRREGDRIAYVAATRARDVLVVPLVGDDPRRGSWLEPLYPALYPRDGTRLSPRNAPGCPGFSRYTVLDAGPASSQPVVPGLHVPEAGEHEVVWWNALGDEVPWRGGLRTTRLLADAEGASDDGAAAYATWRDEHQARRTTGARRAYDVVLATELRAGGTPVALEHSDVSKAGRAGGARFGSLVHAVLAVVAFDADESAIASLVALQGRILGAPTAEKLGACAAVESALRHPLMLRAAVSADCRREVPIAWRDGDRLVEGIADLAFREAGAWVVVDFKTDEDLGARRRVYEAQLAAYVRGVAAATGEPVTGVLFAV